jgi:tyrosyl-tRNA synthetase
VDDRDLPKLFRYFSLLSREEIERLEAEFMGFPNALKAKLAEELTIRIHGQSAFQSAKNVTDILFNAKASKEQLYDLSQTDLALIANEIPSFEIPKSILEEGVSVIDLLSDFSTVLPSKSEARRAIQGGAISVNKDKISDINAVVNPGHLLHGMYMMIENGKKNKTMLILR